jgi:nitroreductase
MRKLQLYYEAEAQGRRRSTEIYRATVATDELDDLGKRLDQIRWTLRCSTSSWAKQHWSQVEAHLVRRIHRINQEMSCN